MEQTLFDSMQKIQISIRFNKLRSMNVNMMFNRLSKLIRRDNQSILRSAFTSLLKLSNAIETLENLSTLKTATR